MGIFQDTKVIRIAGIEGHHRLGHRRDHVRIQIGPGRIHPSRVPLGAGQHANFIPVHLIGHDLQGALAHRADIILTGIDGQNHFFLLAPGAGRKRDFRKIRRQNAIGQEMAQRIEIPSGRSRVHGDPAFAATIRQILYVRIVGTGNNFTPETFPSVFLDDAGKSAAAVGLGHADINQGIGKRDVDTALSDIAHMFVKCIRKDLADAQTGLRLEIADQEMMALERNRVRKLRQVSIRKDLFVFRKDGHFLPHGHVDGLRGLVAGTGGQ